MKENDKRLKGQRQKMYQVLTFASTDWSPGTSLLVVTLDSLSFSWN